MQSAVFFRAGGNKFILCFIAGNRFMLRTVIHKKPLPCLLCRNSRKDNRYKFPRAKHLDERTPKALCLPENHRRNQLRKKHKKPDSKAQRQAQAQLLLRYFQRIFRKFSQAMNFVGSHPQTHLRRTFLRNPSNVVDMPVVSDSTSATTPRIIGSPKKCPSALLKPGFYNLQQFSSARRTAIAMPLSDFIITPSITA